MMKKIYMLLIGLLFISCSSDDSEGGGENTPPVTPNLIYPGNSSLCLENSVTFEWAASSDAQNDPVTYELQVATDNNFSNIINNSLTTAVSRTVALQKGQMYYWRVRAKDDSSANSEFSDTYNFYTEGEGVVNYLPYAPQIVAPVMGSEQASSSIVLEWSSGDADGDALVYDVHFGTDPNSLDEVASDINNTTYTVTANSVGTYYWKITVKDSNGGATVGQLWNFEKV